MRSGPLLLGGALACAGLLSGCLATQSDVLDLENQTDSLKRDIASLSKTMSSLQANQADLAVQIQDLRRDLASYTDTVEETQKSMRTLSSKLDDMSVSVVKNVASIGSALSAEESKALAEQEKSLEKKLLAETTTPSALYQTAQARLALKNYVLAAQGFEDYLKKFPKGALADAAAYQLGQAYYGLGQWEKAGRSFAVVLQHYPNSDLMASSRLMYALSLTHLKGKSAEARQYLESILQDFPKSSEARVASVELKKLAAAKPARAKKKRPAKSAKK